MEDRLFMAHMDLLPGYLWPILTAVTLGAFTAAFLTWRRHGERWRRTRQEAELLGHVVEGRANVAIPELMAQGRMAAAAHLEALRGQPDRAVRLYDRAGDVLGATSVYLATGEYELAGLAYKEAGLMVDAADAFLQGGRADAAAEIYEALHDVDRALVAHREAGHDTRVAALLEQLGRTSEATAARAIVANKEGAHAEAAILWQHAGEQEKAVAAWLDANEPQKAGLLLQELDAHDRAAPLLARPGTFKEAATSYLVLGETREAARCHYHAGATDAAIELLREAEDWTTLARIHHQRGEFDEAVRILKLVAEDHPDATPARALLAEVLSGQGKTAEAIPVLTALVREAVDAGSQDPGLRGLILQLAEAHFSTGASEQALRWMRRLPELGLSTPEIDRRLLDIERRGHLDEETSQAILPQHDRYRFLARIAQGGNGVIYKARDNMLDRTIVIKMIGNTALPSNVAKRFFLREAQTAARLNHPNIVTIYDMGELDGRPYIAMELVEGESLAQHVAKLGGPMEPEHVLDIAENLCEALEYAHAHGVVHRDIKLENVMLTPNGDVKLMDFGLAKAIQDSPDKSIIITGTPLYMSPEQIKGEEADARSDLYSMGVMLYRMLVGRWPYFAGNLLEQHRGAPVPDPQETHPGLPTAFTRFIRRAMAKDKHTRIDNAARLSRELRAAFTPDADLH